LRPWHALGSARHTATARAAQCARARRALSIRRFPACARCSPAVSASGGYMDHDGWATTRTLAPARMANIPCAMPGLHSSFDLLLPATLRVNVANPCHSDQHPRPARLRADAFLVPGAILRKLMQKPSISTTPSALPVPSWECAQPIQINVLPQRRFAPTRSWCREQFWESECSCIGPVRNRQRAPSSIAASATHVVAHGDSTRALARGRHFGRLCQRKGPKTQRSFRDVARCARLATLAHGLVSAHPLRHKHYF
jgi:hypothetical protein